ncbi:MAG: DUF5723 family protein [Bacteroidia bacterium]
MTRHFYLLSLYVLFPFLLASQTLPYASAYDNWRAGAGTQSVSTELNFLLGSNTVQNSFISNYYFGGFIEEDKIETAAGKLLINNTAGLDLNFSTGYFNKKDTAADKGFHYGISVNYLQHYSVAFPDDFFRLIFQGNSRFKGESANLSETEYDDYAYSSVKFHGVKQFSGANSNWLAGGALAFVSGHLYKDLNISQGNLYTSSNADSLQLSLQMNFEQTGQPGNLDLRGAGVAADLFVSWEKGNSIVSFYGLDLGFIRWNDQSELLSIDTSISFTGVDVRSLISGEASADLETSLDSLEARLGGVAKGEAVSKMLPFRLKLNFKRKIEIWKSEVDIGAFYQRTDGYFPLMYVNFEKHLMNWLKIQTGYSYGAYGMGGVALGLSTNLNERFFFSASTWHLDGLLLPQNFRGQSLTIRSSYRF